MRELILDIKDLTDSKELLMAKPPLIMGLFIYLLMFMLIVGFAWLWFGKLDVVVKAPGIIRPAGSISAVKNIVSGDIVTIAFENGSTVKKGDLLYTVDPGTLQIEIDSSKQQIKRTEERLTNLQLLEESITAGKNFFTEEQPAFFNRYLFYTYQLENLTLRYEKALDLYRRNINLPEGSIAVLQLEEYRTNMQFAELNRKKYTSEYRVILQNEIQEEQRKLDLSKERLFSLENSINRTRITSPIDGIVQIIQPFNKGDYLLAGTEVLRIIPEHSSDLKVEIMIPNKDIAQIAVKDGVQFRFASLPHDEYGSLNGKIVKIPGDISSEAAGQTIYKVEASLEDTALYDGDGKKVNVKIGMVCNARVIVREKRILQLLLEKLDFISS